MDLETVLLKRVGPMPVPEKFLEFAIHDLAHWLAFEEHLEAVPGNLSDEITRRFMDMAGVQKSIEEILNEGNDIYSMPTESVAPIFDHEIAAFAVSELAFAEIPLLPCLLASYTSSQVVCADAGIVYEPFRENIEHAKQDADVREAARKLTAWLAGLTSDPH